MVNTDGAASLNGSPLTLQQAADELGVHYMTVYKYVRTGRLPGTKSGGEWRIDPVELKALKTSAAPKRRGRSPTWERLWPKRFEQQLISGDEASAWTVVQDALSSGVDPVEFHLTVLIPTMKSIGHRWESGELSIAAEHQASAIAQRIVGRMGPRFAQRGRKRGHIVVGAPPGDSHGLPSAIFADLLRGRHFQVSDLGANVPIDSFVEFVSEVPDVTAVGIGVTTRHNEDRVRSLVGALKESIEAPVTIGGSAVPSAEVASALGADAWTGDGENGLSLFDEIARIGAVPEQRRLDTNNE
jgi:excisionase family DNA binding protein